MSFSIAVRKSISAAHLLPGYPGRCSKLHGHTWVVEAEFSGPRLNEHGMLMDFDEAKRALEETLKPYDHSNLNEIDPFTRLAPTAENVAKIVFELLESKVKAQGIRLSCVRVWESPSTMASYGESKGA